MNTYLLTISQYPSKRSSNLVMPSTPKSPQFFLTIDKSWNSQDEIASWIALDIKNDVCIWQFVTKSGIALRSKLTSDFESILRKLCWKKTWCRPGIIFQTLLSANHHTGDLNSVQHNFNIDCLEGINASYFIFYLRYIILRVTMRT